MSHDPRDDRAPTDVHASSGDAAQPTAGASSTSGPALPTVVDYVATWHRLRRTLAAIVALVLVAWLVRGAVAGDFALRSLAELVGLGVLLSFAVEVVVVGGSAVRGLLAAGERGDRLSRPDVSLLPPQVGRRQHGP